MVKVVRHWHRLSIEARDVPSLEVFKDRLDGVLRNIMECKMSPTARGEVWTR